MEDNYDVVKEQLLAPDHAKRPLEVLRLDKQDFFVTEFDDESRDDLILEVREELEPSFSSADLDSIEESIISKLPLKEYNSPKAGLYQNLSNEITSKLQDKIGVFHIFTYWENMIKKASGEIINSYSNLHEINEYWTDNILTSIVKLAHAHSGRDTDVTQTNNVVSNAIRTINNTFIDSVEYHCRDIPDLSKQIKFKEDRVAFTRIYEQTPYCLLWNIKNTKYKLSIDNVEKVDNWRALDRLERAVAEQHKTNVRQLIDEYKSIKSNINTRLMIDLYPSSEVQPSNVYSLQSIHGNRKRTLLKSYFKKSGTIIDKEGQVTISRSDINKIKFVELETTPVCDFAQKKSVKYRLLPGIMIPVSILKSENLQGENLYASIPEIDFEGVTYRLIFNFNLIKSADKNDFGHTNALFRLRSNVFSSILSRFSSHSSRIGLFAIE